jgi:hypothetical protein
MGGRIRYRGDRHIKVLRTNEYGRATSKEMWLAAQVSANSQRWDAMGLVLVEATSQKGTRQYEDGQSL